MLRETAAAVKENGLGAALAKFIQATPGAPVTATGYVSTCRGLNCEIQTKLGGNTKQRLSSHSLDYVTGAFLVP